jgi:hypothetical protein
MTILLIQLGLQMQTALVDASMGLQSNRASLLLKTVLLKCVSTLA